MVVRTIKEIHDYFFGKGYVPTGEQVISVYEENQILISKSITNKTGFEKESAIRIKCEYCYALVEKKQFENAVPQFVSVIMLMDDLFDDMKERMENVFYQKLIFNLGVSFYYLKKYKESLECFEKLSDYFPNDSRYSNWAKGVTKELRNEKGFLQRIFRK